MRRFWSGFAAAAAGAVLWAGSAAAGGYSAPAPGPNCGPGYGAPVGHGPNFGPNFGGHGYKGPQFGGFHRPAPPPPICTTTIEWQTTYRTEQRCHETWREVSIPVSVAGTVPGACGPGQVCRPDVYRIKVPHCEPRTVTVPVSNPVRVTTCRQPDANSCGVVGQPLEDRRDWRDGRHDGKRWDRWDDRRSDWRPAPRPLNPPPVYDPAPSPYYSPAPFYTGSIGGGSAFAPSYAGPITNYRAARASLSVNLNDVQAAAPVPAAATTIVEAAAPAAPAFAPASSGGTEWLPF